MQIRHYIQIKYSTLDKINSIKLPRICDCQEIKISMVGPKRKYNHASHCLTTISVSYAGMHFWVVSLYKVILWINSSHIFKIYKRLQLCNSTCSIFICHQRVIHLPTYATTSTKTELCCLLQDVSYHFVDNIDQVL